MNSEQAKFLADVTKIVAVGQFGYFGYQAMQDSHWLALVFSGFFFVYLTYIGYLVLGVVQK